jgi:hypothetical protein
MPYIEYKTSLGKRQYDYTVEIEVNDASDNYQILGVKRLGESLSGLKERVVAAVCIKENGDRIEELLTEEGL